MSTRLRCLGLDTSILALIHVFGVTETAVGVREGHRAVASAAEAAVEDVLHVVDLGALPDWEDLRVTELTTAPDGMLLVREDDGRHPGSLGHDLATHRPLEAAAVDGDPFEIVLQLDQTLFFRLEPVNTVAEPRPGKILDEIVEVVLELHVFAARVTPGAVLDDVTVLGRLFLGKRFGPVVAGAAVEPVPIVRVGDPGLAGGHGEAEVDVAEPAGVLGAVQPVGEEDRVAVVTSGVVVDHDVPVLARLGRALLRPESVGVGLRQDEHRQSNYEQTFPQHPVSPIGFKFPLLICNPPDRGGEMRKTPYRGRERPTPGQTEGATSCLLGLPTDTKGPSETGLQAFGGQGQNGLATLALRAHCVRLSPLRGSVELPTRGFSER